ncbi:MAG: hypothetical protein RI946_962, partial [Pseudomonadota bacterium]
MGGRAGSPRNGETLMIGAHSRR